MTNVNVSQGILRGGKSQTENGLDYYEFLRVPYAKPPVGELRFKSPQSPESWTNERDASKNDRNNLYISSQVDMLAGTVAAGSEDCLYLNVYTPQLPDPDSEPLPVIVYIHGGGFVVGNGIVKSECGPDYLLEQNTVVVTINYRLGVLGFLSLGIAEAAGNMGLKDQVKALEWVRDNIEHFGGDKNNVTLMGISAGSASIEYLMLSPKAKGLFHKVILQSGSTLNHWAINFQPVDVVQELVKILDYKGSLEDNKAIYEFLLTVPASNLTLAASKAAAKYSSKICLFCGFVPTVEKEYGNGDAFLTSPPYKLLKEGNYTRVPVLRGFCSREGALTCVMKPNAKKNLMETCKFVDSYPYDIESNEKEEYNLKFSSAYLSNEIENSVEDFFGDLDFISGVWIAGKILSMHMPVYMYQFGHAGKINGLKKLFQLSLDEPGALHGDDFTYVFKHEAVDGADENDVLVRERIVTMFTNFAKFGKPVLATSDLIPVEWPPFTKESQVFLCIDKNLHLKTDYEPKKMAIFEELYAKAFI